MIFVQHTYEGKKMDRGGRYFTVHGARVGPEGEPALSQRWRQRSLDLDERTYSDAEREYALASVDADNRWSEPDQPSRPNSAADNEAWQL